jgi:predicted amidohydrolase
MNDGGFFEPSPLRIIPYLNVSSPGIFAVSAAVTVGECADLRLLRQAARRLRSSTGARRS